MSEERRLAVLRAIVQDYVQTSEPVGLEGARRAPPPGRLGRDRPQRHGDPRGGGPDPRAAHSAGRVPDRRGVPPLRRPAQLDQADVRGREVGDPDLPVRRRRPRRRRRPDRAAALHADPPGRGHAVPQPHPVHRAPYRAGPARGGPADGRRHRQHRPGRAADRRHRRRPDQRGRRVVRGPAALRAQRRGRLAAVPRGVRPARRRSPTGSSRPTATRCAPSRGRSTRPCSRSARSGSCWPARPTWRGSDPTSR